jgi:hypothetical protein
VEHCLRKAACIGHHGTGLTGYHPLAHAREIALGAIGMPGKQFGGHDEAQHGIAEELEPLVRPRPAGRPLAVSEGLAAKRRIEQVE